MRNLINAALAVVVFVLSSPSEWGLAQLIIVDEPSITPPQTITGSKTGISGEWGTLEHYPILLEPSDYYITKSSDFETWNEPTIWQFDSDQKEDVIEKLANAGLDLKLVNELTEDKYFLKDPVSGRYEIHPPDYAILNLTPEQRAKLYPQLLPQTFSNPFFTPYYLPEDEEGGIFSIAPGIPVEQIDLINALSYSLNNLMAFSDVRLVLSKTKNATETVRTLKTIARQRSLSVGLRVTESQDLKGLASYWGAGGRNREVLPILEAVAKTQGVDVLDIVHLLPPNPRKLLHTFPSANTFIRPSETPDCFSTAFSFFGDDPPDRLLDSVSYVFEERYEEVSPPLQFGDLIGIGMQSDGRTIHVCNHIAGNLVFTKNGISLARPWVISTLEDVTLRYRKRGPIKVSYSRLKPEYQK